MRGGSKNRKTKMTKRELHNGRDPQWEEDRKIGRENTVATVTNLYKSDLLKLKVPLQQNLLFVFDCYLIQY